MQNYFDRKLLEQNKKKLKLQLESLLNLER